MREVKKAIEECAKRRITMRRLASGAYRVSLPIPVQNDHLLELSYRESTKPGTIRVSDGGEFFSFISEEKISRNSKAYEDALAAFEHLGFDVVGEEGQQELAATVTTAEVGCTSLDFGFALASVYGTLLRDIREGIPRFERKIWVALKPVHDYLQRNVEVAPKVKVPIRVRNSNTIAVFVGSYGETIEPEEVTRRQTFPFYRLGVAYPEKRFKKYALVDDEFWREQEVKDLIKDAKAEPILRSRLNVFEGIVRQDVGRL